MAWQPDDYATSDRPLVGPECERDYLTLTGLGLLSLTFVCLVALALPLFLR